MAATAHTAPQGGQIRHLEITIQGGDSQHMAVEQIPAGYRLPFAILFNLWAFYSHMQGRTYLTVEAFLDDAHPGWQSWQEEVRLPIMTNAQETAVIKAALQAASIRPTSVRHYLDPVIIVMGRPEACEGEFLQIRDMALQALEDAIGVRILCRGISYSWNVMEKQRLAMKNSVSAKVDRK